MNVVDSSGWLEVLLGDSGEGHFDPIFQDREALLVPALVMFEVTKRAFVLRGEAYADGVMSLLRSGVFIEVSSRITVTAIGLSMEHKLSTADSLIYATSLEYDATLWTQDKHFKGLPPVKYFEKRA